MKGRIVSEAEETAFGGRFREQLAAARQGNTHSLGRILEVFKQYLLLVADRELDGQLKAKGSPSDLVQDTFYEAQRDFANFTGLTEDELRAWLRRILLNNVSNFRRFHLDTEKRDAGRERSIEPDSSGNDASPDLASPQQTPSQWAIKNERIDAVDKALARLPGEQRQVIILRNQQHLSFEAIGAKIDRTADAARKLWARAVEKLQFELGQSDDSSFQ
jgi:RNA polymerase sigma-70 factor (ECF subfamily)